VRKRTMTQTPGIKQTQSGPAFLFPARRAELLGPARSQGLQGGPGLAHWGEQALGKLKKRTERRSPDDYKMRHRKVFCALRLRLRAGLAAQGRIAFKTLCVPDFAALDSLTKKSTRSFIFRFLPVAALHSTSCMGFLTTFSLVQKQAVLNFCKYGLPSVWIIWGILLRLFEKCL
jgi:hypothetical protein